MKEQLYTIPVTDAFRADCECPICKLKYDLEQNAIDYTLGPSYMEDDNRAQTDALGFCELHIQMLYRQKNRLGLALILSTHMKKTVTDLRQLSNPDVGKSTSFLHRIKYESDGSALSTYADNLSNSCFICGRMRAVLQRYIETVFHLYRKDPAFSHLLSNSKGFCISHFAALWEQAESALSGEMLIQFRTDLNRVFFANMDRVQEDMDWFINKFDYRYQSEPWKNAKDALPRTMLKTHSVMPPEN